MIQNITSLPPPPPPPNCFGSIASISARNPHSGEGVGRFILHFYLKLFLDLNTRSTCNTQQNLKKDIIFGVCMWGGWSFYVGSKASKIQGMTNLL